MIDPVGSFHVFYAALRGGVRVSCLCSSIRPQSDLYVNGKIILDGAVFTVRGGDDGTGRDICL